MAPAAAAAVEAAALAKAAAAVGAQVARPPPAVARVAPAPRLHSAGLVEPCRSALMSGEAKTDAPPAAAALVPALVPSGGCAAMTGRAKGAAGTAAAAGLWCARGRRDYRRAARAGPAAGAGSTSSMSAGPATHPGRRANARARSAGPRGRMCPDRHRRLRAGAAAHHASTGWRATSGRQQAAAHTSAVRAQPAVLSDGTFFRPPKHRRCQPPSQPSQSSI